MEALEPLTGLRPAHGGSEGRIPVPGEAAGGLPAAPVPLRVDLLPEGVAIRRQGPGGMPDKLLNLPPLLHQRLPELLQPIVQPVAGSGEGQGQGRQLDLGASIPGIDHASYADRILQGLGPCLRINESLVMENTRNSMSAWQLPRVEEVKR
eukprot:763062-Hanusia_phi.AAC.5